MRNPFKRRADELKYNPNSLREVLIMVRSIEGLSRESFAEKLIPYCGRYRKSKLPAKTIRQIELDETRIQYWHLEVYANYLGMPSSALLLFSRLRANELSSKSDESVKLIESFKQVISSVDEKVDYSEALLREWSETFDGKKDLLL